MASALLASDLNNPDYAGATNPDSRLAVQFYSRTAPNEFESTKQGRPIFYDLDFVKIFVPGDPTTVIDQPVRDDHKQRFPLQWAHYQNKHGGDQKEIGTPLAQWPRLMPAQAEELRALKFYTVESIANAADSALQRIGMVAGMSPYAFRDAAQRFLSLAAGEAKATEADNRIKVLEEENRVAREAADAKLAEARESFEKQLAEMRALVEQATAPKAAGKRAGNAGTA